MVIRTIFLMAQDCARGERMGWQEFVRDYAGIARGLLAHYFPDIDRGRDAACCVSTTTPNFDEHVVAVFRRAGSNGSAWFAGLSFSNEREFMMAFRDLVFAYGREQDCIPPSEVTLDRVQAVMKDLNLLERELLWLFIKGYDAAQIAAIMMNAAATTEAVQRIADERLAALVAEAAPGALSRSARALMAAAEQSRSQQCPSLKTFNDLVNGQITWRDREVAEEHINNCFYCIDRFTTFQEMVRLRKEVPQLPPAEVEAILAQFPLAAKRRRVLSRLLARRAI